jgi:hypothetical protein
VTQQPVLLLTRPAKVMKSRVVVERPDGAAVGEIVQDNVFGKIHRPLADPLASLVVGSALTVDTALKQDDRGFG